MSVSAVLRWLLRAALLAAIVGGAWWSWRAWQADRKKEPSWVTEAVVRATLVEKVTATGTLQPMVTVLVGSTVSGRILKLNADFNSRVTEGQLLAELDPAIFRAQVLQARAQRASAEAGVVRAKAKARDAQRAVDRLRLLYPQHLATQAEYDTALATRDGAGADVDAAKADVQQAQAALDLAQTNLDKTQIFAPVSGVVLQRSVDVGQTVAASLQAPTLFTLAADLEKMQLHASVDEADIGRLRAGLGATFTVDAFAGETFVGKVRQLRFAPQIVQNVVTYDAVVDVDNPGERLRPGMTATVTFETRRAEDVLAVPNAALRFKLAPSDAEPRKGSKNEHSEGALQKPHVYVLGPGGQPKLMSLEIGISDGRLTEIKQGRIEVGAGVVVRKMDDGKAGGGASLPGVGGGGGKGSKGAKVPKRLF